jgi:hypothetical protein
VTVAEAVRDPVFEVKVVQDPPLLLEYRMEYPVVVVAAGIWTKESSWLPSTEDVNPLALADTVPEELPIQVAELPF